ncbi:MAG: STAS domain-containing protein [Verrucomicrobiia bacterium]
MTLHEHKSGAWTILDIDGRVDHLAAPQLQARLLELVREGCRGIILNCAQLTYLSSAGLRVLLLAAQHQRDSKLTLRLCSLNPNIRHFFEISGLLQWLQVYPSSFEASRDSPTP